MHAYRSHTCAELNKSHVGDTVRLSGWVHRIRDHGGVPVAAVSLIDRSDGSADVGVPLIALCTLAVPTYPADALPPELAAIPASKPGSGGLRAS